MSQLTHSIANRIGLLLLTMLLVLGMSACNRVPRVRTLPPSVKTAYVPMVLNRSAEPAVEERLTAYLQEEILADGRLRLVQRNQADVIVEFVLRDFRSRPVGFDGNEFGTARMYEMTGNLAVRENIAELPLIGGYRPVPFKWNYNDDTRSTTYEPEPMALENALRFYAREIVRELMTGEIREISDSPARP